MHKFTNSKYDRGMYISLCLSLLFFILRAQMQSRSSQMLSTKTPKGNSNRVYDAYINHWQSDLPTCLSLFLISFCLKQCPDFFLCCVFLVPCYFVFCFYICYHCIVIHFIWGEGSCRCMHTIQILISINIKLAINMFKL